MQEKVVCFWSRDFDVREKKKREALEERIQEFLGKSSKYNSSIGTIKILSERNITQQIKQ